MVIAALGRVFNIDLPTGVVTDLGVMAFPSAHARCETSAFWGVAEVINGRVHLTYVRNSTQIARTRVPDGATSVVGTFTNLGDMCAITVSPSRNRWYFHHEGTAQFGGTAETLGYCGASLTAGAPVSCAPSAALRCGDLCFDGQTDDANCGRCGNACPFGQACRAGACTPIGRLGGYSLTTPPASVTFVDACADPGATNILAGRQNVSDVTLLPFAFPFWGDVLPAGHVTRVATTGYVSFDTTLTGVYAEAAIPSTMAPNGLIAPWHSPMQADGPNGICYVTLGASPSRRFVVEWSNSLTVSTAYSPGRITTELILNEADGAIDLLTSASTLPPGASAPIGVETLDGSRGVTACGASTCPAALTRARFVPSP